MKVFISHKQEDGITASLILQKLRDEGVDAYLDLLEGELLLKGEKLTQHIKKRINECTDLMAIVSNLTQQSWWVPFEIGMAAQKDFPIVTFLKDGVQLPDYLDYWPKLTRLSDINKYVAAKKDIEYQIAVEHISRYSYQSDMMFSMITYETPTERFYRDLKSRLL